MKNYMEKEEFSREQRLKKGELGKLREAYSKLYRVDNKAMRNISYCQKSALNDICALSTLEVDRDQESIDVVDKLFSFEDARKAFKKY